MTRLAVESGLTLYLNVCTYVLMNAKRTTTLTFRLSPEERKIMGRAAADSGVSEGEWLRRVVAYELLPASDVLDIVGPEELDAKSRRLEEIVVALNDRMARMRELAKRLTPGNASAIGKKLADVAGQPLSKAPVRVLKKK